MTEPIDVHKVFASYFENCEALAYALSSRLNEGNICVNIAAYKAELPGLLEMQRAKESFSERDSVYWVSPEEFDKQCAEGKFTTLDETVLKPFIIHKGYAYLHRYFTYETQILENTGRLKEHFHIITGGPGSGKTYSVSTTLVKMFGEDINLRIALAAPTGKAAARMNESIRKFAQDIENNIPEEIKTKLTGLKAQTLHRLLGYQTNSVFFRHNENNRLLYDVVIIDECSMVDGAIMAKLLNSVEGNTSLYLLGDKDQLASVEAGSVFGDLCRARYSDLLKGEGKVVVKEESWRFDPGKGIGKFSKEVIGGEIPAIESYDNNEQLTIDTTYSTELFEQYASMYKEYIQEDDISLALKKLNKIRFLCVTRENDRSVSKVNKQIQYYLSTQIEGFKPKQEGFYHNQPIIITQNDYQLNIFNGDVGIVRNVNTNSGTVLYAHFESSDGSIKKIQAGFLNHYESVFAMTIHKSQGSEFDYVVVILPEKQGERLLTRELLYTGVTRAKTKVLLQTSEEALNRCVNSLVSRASGLENRLKP